MTELAELADRLRRFRSRPGAPPPPGAERLAVAARLVARLGAETGHAGTSDLGRAAVDLAAAAGRAQPAVDERLLDLLAALAGLLEDLLAAVDRGRRPADFLARVDWERYRPAAPVGAAPPVAPAPGPALLLVASDFRRRVLADRLAAAGLASEVVPDPDAAVARLRRAPAPRWIVCDDQEPERHLGRLRGLLAGGPDRPRLVLLAAAAGPGQGPEAAEILAARRGADLVWREPFDPADLPV